MTKRTEIAQELAALLEQHRQEIATAWTEMVHQLPYYNLPASIELTHALTTRGLKAISHSLATGSYTKLKAHLIDVNQFCLQNGSEIDEVIETFLLLTDAALPVILRAYPLNSAAIKDAIARVNFFSRWMISFLAKLYVVEFSQRLREQQERTATLLEIARAASGTLELDEVLRRVARGIATAVSVPYCGFYLVDEERSLLIPRTGVDEHVPSSTAPGEAFRDWTRTISATNAFVCQVLEEKRPLTCYDALTDPRTNKKEIDLKGFKSMLAVPFVVKERVLAIAFACTFQDYRTFSQEQIDLAWGIANAVALAIENARLYQQVEQMAVIEERDRLAREMHDNLSQMLGVMNWRTATLNSLLSGGQIAQAQASLRELQQIIKEAYTDVREAIFNLRASASSGLEFLPALQEYLADYRRYYGLDARLVVDTQPLPEFPANTKLQIIRIIQEALTNVRKHARASNAYVHLTQNDNWVYITIQDNGQGFDPTQMTERGQHHFGLQIMRERAESIGGELKFVSRPDQGTQVVMRLPLTPGG